MRVLLLLLLMKAGAERLWRFHLRHSLRAPAPPPGSASGLTQLLLYCRVGIGFHLQILPDGSVAGVHRPDQYCHLKVSSVSRGTVGIRGEASGLFLCLNKEGGAYGSVTFTDDCQLRENLEENLYTTYASHPGVYLALSHKGAARRGTRVSPRQACTHFLPRRIPK
ncbi:fibroblast growth factor 4 [Synchiropus splendidus]|uniref:fibroblast growth factor 4 n=1 Tax=Synchiropus splendidus TaxID=270530 RepID=UPI00237E2C66|nr:fibroblast growth factor 4 [Synchiropus splendidus]